MNIEIFQLMKKKKYNEELTLSDVTYRDFSVIEDNVAMLEESITKFDENDKAAKMDKRIAKLLIEEIRELNKKLRESTEQLRETVKSYKKHITKRNEAVDECSKITAKNHMNYTAFSRHLCGKSVTHNTFKRMSDKEKRAVIKNSIPSYLKIRNKAHIEQDGQKAIFYVLQDAFSSKGLSLDSIENVSKLLEEYGFVRYEKDFYDKERDMFYILPDQKGTDKKVFEDIMNKEGILYEFALKKQGKMPDFLFKVKDHIYIMETKKLNPDTGSSQYKQMSELIDFIRYQEENEKVHYISLLEGGYSNLLMESTTGQVVAQRRDIERQLEQSPQNFFVNKKIFEVLLNHILERKAN